MLFNASKKTINAQQQTIALQASQLEAINRSMAVIEFDLNGIVLAANENFLKTMGYRSEPSRTGSSACQTTRVAASTKPSGSTSKAASSNQEPLKEWVLMASQFGWRPATTRSRTSRATW